MTYYHNSLTMNIIIHYKLKKKKRSQMMKKLDGCTDQSSLIGFRVGN